MSKTNRKNKFAANKPIRNNSVSLILPILLAAVIVPNIVYVFVLKIPAKLNDFWITNDYHNDIFAFGKTILLLGLSLISLIILVFYAAKNKDSFLRLKSERIIIPVGVFALLTALSTLFSGAYFSTAVLGFPDRYEGLLVFFCYILLWLSILLLVNSERLIRLVIGSILAGSLYFGSIGLFQYLKMDFFKTDISKYLIIPPNLWEHKDKVAFRFEEGIIYATFLNPNYVGGITAVIIVLSVALVILLPKKQEKVVCAFFALLMAVNLLGSGSRAGMVGLAAGLAALVLIVALAYNVNKKLISGAVLFILIGGITLLSTDVLGIKGMLEAAKDPYADKNSYDQSAKSMSKIYDIRINGSTVSYITDTGTLNITLNADSASLSDGDGAAVETYKQTNGDRLFIALNDKRFSKVEIFKEREYFQVKALSTGMIYTVQGNEAFVVNTAGSPTRLLTYEEVPKVAILDRYGRLGSNRLNIWSRSIPLIKDTIFLGHGPDTFAMYYPQNEYMNKIKYFDNSYIVIDKPHNLYIQMALNQGVLALLAFLSAVGFYLYCFTKNLKTYTISNIYVKYNVAICCSIIAFLALSFFNDSTTPITMVFWILWGLGCVCNKLCSQTMLT